MDCGHPWLPEGWKAREKVRSCGRKDKYYVNLANDLKFNSKPEVLRYLESSEKDNKPNEPNKIDSKTNAVKYLPPGWIKEIRITEKRGRVRRDQYFTDTVSGHQFHSLREVFRYLESKDSGKPKCKLDDVELDNDPNSLCANGKEQRSINQKTYESLNGHEAEKSALKLASNNVNTTASNHLEQRGEEGSSQDIKLSDQPQPAKRKKQQANVMMKTEKSAENKVDRSADAGQLLISGSKVASLEKADAPIKVAEENHEESGSGSGKLFNKLVSRNEMEGPKGGRRQSKRLAEIKLKESSTIDQSLQVTEGAEDKTVDVPEQREKENHSTGDWQDVNRTIQKKKTNSKRKWASDLPRRTSKRLARVEVDRTLEVKTSEKAGADARRLPIGAEVKTAKDICKAELANEPEVYSKGKITAFNNTVEYHRTELPSNQVNHVSSLHEQNSFSVDSTENKNPKNCDSVMNDLLMDPCIEFAIKTLTGAIPIEEIIKVNNCPTSSLAPPNQVSSSSSTQPSVNIWADPCFEFAVKTLTSNAPTENNSSPQFQITFQQPLSSSGNDNQQRHCQSSG